MLRDLNDKPFPSRFRADGDDLLDTKTGTRHLIGQGFGVCDRVADRLNYGTGGVGEIRELADQILKPLVSRNIVLPCGQIFGRLEGSRVVELKGDPETLPDGWEEWSKPLVEAPTKVFKWDWLFHETNVTDSWTRASDTSPTHVCLSELGARTAAADNLKDYFCTGTGPCSINFNLCWETNKMGWQRLEARVWRGEGNLVGKATLLVYEVDLKP